MEHEQNLKISSEQEPEEHLSKFERDGIIFSRIPDSIYPGMPYITANELVANNVTRYSIQHLKNLVRNGSISGQMVAGKVIFTPNDVTQLLEREKSSMEYPQSARRPGPKNKKNVEK